ncbi:MAG: hypothetical protein KME60_31175 [Cyanomargarita calcarea GSE-NOS-MK-12-04C]|uniref:Uncharacterized protein n=1 Tax=Cyanomargarita calcarea GSE-NOS-MK-12-04C TaxID=2839659 RepID=A0A951QW92_9CYAN|nr:hypothetical protein [Cyanomargarita calcarea GSE-NOS-MK-12-04C]
MLTKNQPFQQRSLSYRYPQNPIKFLGEGSDLPFASGILKEVGDLTLTTRQTFLKIK